MNTNIYHLSNGLTVIYVVNPSALLSSACLCINAGAKNDTKKFGLAHAVEHSIFSGSDHHSSDMINLISYQHGCSIDGFTDMDFTSFSFKATEEAFTPMLHLMSDMLIYPNFSQQKLDEEMNVIKTEMTIDADDFDCLADGNELSTCFGIDKKAPRIFGTKESISKISIGDVRCFWEKYYTAANSVLCIYAPHKKFMPLIETCFAPMRSGACYPLVPVDFKGGCYHIKEYCAGIEFKLIFGSPTYDLQDELLSTALAGNFGARLYQKLRCETSLIYSVSSQIDNYSYGNLFYVSTSCRAKNLEDVIAKTCEEIRLIRESGISEQNLQCAKETYKMKLLGKLESPTDLISDYGEDFFLKRFTPVEKELELIDTVTLEDVNGAAQRIFSHKPTYGIIGDVRIPSYSSILTMLGI